MFFIPAVSEEIAVDNFLLFVAVLVLKIFILPQD
jgi:hypothetical protein